MDLPFDATYRRRIYLLRHAEAGYFDENGRRIADSRAARLTAWGQAEALSLCKALAGVPFDMALCSGLPRTVETARLVLGGRNLALGIVPELEELRGNLNNMAKNLKPHEIAYAMFGAALPDASFYGGERFDDFLARVTAAFKRIAELDFRNLLLVCHGGTNRAIISWALDAGLKNFGQFEQDSACVNIIDIDVAREGENDRGAIRRIIFRGINLTPEDIAKHEKRLTTLESMTERLMKSLQKFSGQVAS
jgi:probable phosphoglycerate mutase